AKMSSETDNLGPLASPLSDAANRFGGGSGKQRMSVEKIYQKKTQLEHILLRPDTYIGSVESVRQNMWVYDSTAKRMIEREITFVPGLYKIFDEVLVNAADNKQRDPGMSCIRITISKEDNLIEVWNNGKGIPVVEHKKEKLYVPTLIFGHLLTSSNFNDSEKKTTGGRNGYGAKLCNVYSRQFTVETSCKESGKRFQQTWTDNMGKAGEAKIMKNGAEDYTKVSFKPDLTKFGMTELDDDTIALFSRRAFDIAGTCSGVRVFLNGEKLPVTSFKDYYRLYLTEKEDKEVAIIKSGRWELAVCLSNDGFKQVSFVNSIATTKGGRHVDFVCDLLLKRLVDAIDGKCKADKKNLKGSIKPAFVKNHLWIFCNCLIENPSFDSQTKEFMTLQAKKFGSAPELDDKFFKKLLSEDCGIVRCVLEYADFKTNKALNQRTKASKKTFHEKLDHANNAGKGECVLILTEGDSAKSLAVAGASSLPDGRDRFGVFPLKGKLLNVREASKDQLMNNKEIKVIQDAVNLQYGKKYNTVEDLKSLRYRHIMIMTDQDQDGSHIKGLIINFIHFFWPELLRHDFLQEFITPIVKVTKRDQVKAFYSMPEFDEWRGQTPDWHKWHVKYYKGLGTSTAKEGREYFRDMRRHCVRFIRRDQTDEESILMAFGKNADMRKDWLLKFMDDRKRRADLGLPEAYLYEKTTREISYNDFVHKELVLFSNADNERSIPSLVDGLKPGQRKVMYTCFKRNLLKEIKVAQLAGSVSEISAYHHGEASLVGTIINLAQDFVGSNNLNLLMPNGQFGSRLQGGKDAAAARYIHTCLSPLARIIFNPNDEPMLEYNVDDNQRVEPVWYIPIIPMVLINGADGIGTGWSTKIPNYSVDDVIANLRRMLRDEEPRDMLPSYRGFTGIIRQTDAQRYVSYGEVRTFGDANVVEITELPVKVWSEPYQDSVLKVGVEGGDGAGGGAGGKKKTDRKESKPNEQLLEDFNNYCSDTHVRLVVKLKPEQMANARQVGLHKYFKLQNTFSTSSMVLFDRNCCLKRYDSVLDILREFYSLRLEWYEKRKAYLLGRLGSESLLLDNQARFVQEKIDNLIRIENVAKKKIVAILVERGYDSDPVKAWRSQQPYYQQLQQIAKSAGTAAAGADEDAATADDDDDEAAAADAGQSVADFDYILRMPLWSLTLERKEKLLKDRADKAEQMRVLRAKTPKDLWSEDLDELEAKMRQIGEETAKADRKAARGKAKRAGSDDDDFESDGDDSGEEYGKKKKPKKKPAGKKAGKGAAGAAIELPRVSPTVVEPAMEEPAKPKQPRAPKAPKAAKEPKDSSKQLKLSDMGVSVGKQAAASKKTKKSDDPFASSSDDNDETDEKVKLPLWKRVSLSKPEAAADLAEFAGASSSAGTTETAATTKPKKRMLGPNTLPEPAMPAAKKPRQKKPAAPKADKDDKKKSKPKATKKSKKAMWGSSDDDNTSASSDANDSDNVGASDNDDEGGEAAGSPPPPPRERTERRGAAAKAKYVFDDSSEDDDNQMAGGGRKRRDSLDSVDD
ncbi:hypothetical protein BOX15_Mlig014497g1, partial [Macrostomum lignano]